MWVVGRVLAHTSLAPLPFCFSFFLFFPPPPFPLLLGKEPRAQYTYVNELYLHNYPSSFKRVLGYLPLKLESLQCEVGLGPRLGQLGLVVRKVAVVAKSKGG